MEYKILEPLSSPGPPASFSATSRLTASGFFRPLVSLPSFAERRFWKALLREFSSADTEIARSAWRAACPVEGAARGGAPGSPVTHQSTGVCRINGRTFPERLASFFNSLGVSAIPARLPTCSGPRANRARILGAISPLRREKAALGPHRRLLGSPRPSPGKHLHRVPSMPSVGTK